MRVYCTFLQGEQVMCETQSVVSTTTTTQVEVLNPLNPQCLDDYLDKVDIIHDDTAMYRNELILQLAAGVRSIDFTDINSAKPGDVEKKLMAVDTLERLLSSKEKSVINQANLRLKQREAKGAEALGQMAADILTKIDLSIRTGPSTPLYTIDPSQEQALAKLAELETIPSTEMRLDPYHLDEE